MDKILRITGGNEDVLDISLADFLKTIKIGNEYLWSILWLRGVSFEGKKSAIEVEEEIDSSENGLIETWDELLEMSLNFSQIIEIIIIGDKNNSVLKKYSKNIEMYNNCEVVIELVDSSYWLFYSKNKELMELVKRNFVGVYEEDLLLGW